MKSIRVVILCTCNAYCEFRMNCETKAAKIIRKYYKRPYYLPDMAQGHSFNSIISAKGNHSGTVFTVSCVTCMV